MRTKTKNSEFQSPQALRPSMAALAFATRITVEDFNDVYRMAVVIDDAFAEGFARARMEERQRIFKMSPLELIREFWKGKRLYRPDVIEERAGRPNPL